MNVKPRIAFWMPVFNQVLELPNVLRELAENPLPCDGFLIVDNGSSDGSEKLVAGSGHRFIRLPENLGIGHGFQVASKWALEENYDYLGVIASNGKMLPAEAARLVDPILAGAADCVTGSRFIHGGGYPNLPLFRRISIPLVNLFIFCISGHSLTDATCGYRVFPLDILRRAEFDWNAEWLRTYGFEYYIYAKALFSKRYRCIEVPITMRYPPKGVRYSKIRGLVDWMAMLKPWVRAVTDGKWFKPDPLEPVK